MPGRCCSRWSSPIVRAASGTAPWLSPPSGWSVCSRCRDAGSRAPVALRAARPPVLRPRPSPRSPLPLHVVLAEVDLSLARLQTLAPGDRLPLTMGRQVPLMMGEKLVAHGSIGALEDRMALRLTRFPPQKDPHHE